MLETPPSNRQDIGAQAIIAPGLSPWILLVPAMEKPETSNTALIEFMRARIAVTGHGFASFLPAEPGRFDEISNFATTRKLMTALTLAQDARSFVVVAAPRERRTLSLLHSPAYRVHGMPIETMEETSPIYESLPARVALAKRLAAVTKEIRSRSFAQHHNP